MGNAALSMSLVAQALSWVNMMKIRFLFNTPLIFPAAVMGCIGGVVTGPGDVVICTGGVLGAGSTCFECMCDVFDWLASHVLGGLCWDWGCVRC